MENWSHLCWCPPSSGVGVPVCKTKDPLLNYFGIQFSMTVFMFCTIKVMNRFKWWKIRNGVLTFVMHCQDEMSNLQKMLCSIYFPLYFNCEHKNCKSIWECCVSQIITIKGHDQYFSEQCKYAFTKSSNNFFLSKFYWLSMRISTKCFHHPPQSMIKFKHMKIQLLRLVFQGWTCSWKCSMSQRYLKIQMI